MLEIGCGSGGGFVPDLLRAGYGATGIDPRAPDGPDYDRVEFESQHLGAPVDATVACTSLHHVADLDPVLDKVAAALTPGGTVVVAEWGVGALRRAHRPMGLCLAAQTGPSPRR